MNMFNDLPVKKRKAISNAVNIIMAEWYGFDLTTEQVAELLDDNNAQWLTDILVNGFDTCVREGLADALAVKCTKHRWPGGYEDAETFWKELATGAAIHGYKPTDNALWNFKTRDSLRIVGDPVEADCLGEGGDLHRQVSEEPQRSLS